MIRSYRASDKYHFWAGGTDRGNEGTWKWVTGEKWKYTNWEPGQPNNSKANDPDGQDYLELWIFPERSGYKNRIEWNDEPNNGYSVHSPEKPSYLSLPYYGYICEWEAA